MNEKRRINITIEDGIDDNIVIALMASVIAKGRISGIFKKKELRQYCYATVFENYTVCSREKTKPNSDSFVIFKNICDKK